MKVTTVSIFFLAALSIQFYSRDGLQASEEANCQQEEQAQEICNMSNLKFMANTLEDEYFRLAKLNSPEDTMEAKVRLEEMYNTIIQCDPSIQCSEFSKKKSFKLSNDWTEQNSIDTWTMMTADNKKHCSLNAEIHLSSSEHNLRGIISRKNWSI